MDHPVTISRSERLVFSTDYYHSLWWFSLDYPSLFWQYRHKLTSQTTSGYELILVSLMSAMYVVLVKILKQMMSSPIAPLKNLMHSQYFIAKSAIWFVIINTVLTLASSKIPTLGLSMRLASLTSLLRKICTGYGWHSASSCVCIFKCKKII